MVDIYADKYQLAYNRKQTSQAKGAGSGMQDSEVIPLGTGSITSKQASAEKKRD